MANSRIVIVPKDTTVAFDLSPLLILLPCLDEALREAIVSTLFVLCRYVSRVLS